LQFISMHSQRFSRRCTRTWTSSPARYSTPLPPPSSASSRQHPNLSGRNTLPGAQLPPSPSPPLSSSSPPPSSSSCEWCSKAGEKAVITSDMQASSHADANCKKYCFAVISPTATNKNNNNNNNSCEKKLQKKMAHKCSLEKVLFTSHYIDISHELHINEQQIKEKVENRDKSETRHNLAALAHPRISLSRATESPESLNPKLLNPGSPQPLQWVWLRPGPLSRCSRSAH